MILYNNAFIITYRKLLKEHNHDPHFFNFKSINFFSSIAWL